MTEQLMTAVQVAELLAVPKTRVWSMSRRGEIPTMRIRPREVRYRREDIDVWIARRASRVARRHGRAVRAPEPAPRRETPGERGSDGITNRAGGVDSSAENHAGRSSWSVRGSRPTRPSSARR